MTGETAEWEGNLNRCDGPAGEAEAAGSRRRGWADRLGHRRWLPEVISQPRRSILEDLDEAGRPEPGRAEVPGWRRAWTRFVSVPVKVINRSWEDAADKPERFVPAVLLTMLISTALNQFLPIVQVVTFFLDMSTWF